MDPAARARAILDRKKARTEGRSNLPPLPDTAHADRQAPSASAADVPPPLSKDKQKSTPRVASEKTLSDRPDKTPSKSKKKRNTPDDADNSPSGQRDASRLRPNDMLQDLPLQTPGPSTARTTRSQGDPPASILKAKEFQPMRRYLKSLINSADKAILDATPSTQQAEAAIMSFPKVMLQFLLTPLLPSYSLDWF